MIERKCCPMWAIITAVLVILAVAAIVICVLKKMQLLGRKCHIIQDGCYDEECDCNEEEDESGVRYTNDKDFV